MAASLFLAPFYLTALIVSCIKANTVCDKSLLYYNTTGTKRFNTTGKGVSGLSHDVLAIVELACVGRIAGLNVLTGNKIGKYYGA